MNLSDAMHPRSVPDSPLDRDWVDEIEFNGSFPLTHGQLCFWVVHFLMGETANNLSRLLLSGPVDPGLMEKTINLILQRHDSLRSQFGEIMPLQRTQPYEYMDMAYEDLSTLTFTAQQDLIADDVREFMAAFDLTRSPLIRVKLYRLNDREHLLLSAFPHIVLDGSGVHIFEQEVLRLYRQMLTGKGVSQKASNLALPLARYVAWEKQRATASEDTQIHFWQKALQGFQWAAVPACYQATESGKHFDRMISIPPSVVSDVQKICRDSQVTFQMCMLAIVAVSVGRFSKSSSVVLNSVLENRSAPGMESLYAPTLYLMPVPIDLGNVGSNSWTSLLPGIKQHITQAYDNLDIPFSIMQGILAGKRWIKGSSFWKSIIQFTSRWIARLFKKSQLHSSFLADYLLVATPPNRIHTLPAECRPKSKRLVGAPDPVINVNILQSFYKEEHSAKSGDQQEGVIAKSLSDPLLFLPAEPMDGAWEDQSINIYIVMDNDGNSYFRLTCSCLNEPGVNYLSDCLSSTVRQASR